MLPMKPRKLSAMQQSVLDVFSAHPGVYLHYRMGPAATVQWSDKTVDDAWRKEHRQRPVAMNVAQALVRGGKLRIEIDSKRRRIEYRTAA